MAQVPHLVNPYRYETRLGWSDYLKSAPYEDAIRVNVNRQTRELIASQEAVGLRHDERLSEIGEGLQGVARGIERSNRHLADIHDELVGVRGAIERVGEILIWGFNEVLFELRGLRASLDTLVRLARTPSQVWAYEQYDIARNAFERGLYRESLQYVQRSISGHGSNTGYDLDYRFHFLKGLIHLGSFRNVDDAILDLNAAHDSFMYAVRYAGSEVTEASRAWLSAGWASYCMGKTDEALNETERSIQLAPDFLDAYYQSAQILALVGECDGSMVRLATAVWKDKIFALKASSDDNFKDCISLLDKTLERIRIEMIAQAGKNYESFSLKLRQIDELGTSKYRVAEVVPVAYSDAKKTIRSLETLNEHPTLFNAFDSLRLLSSKRDQPIDLFHKFHNASTRKATAALSDAEERLESAKLSQRLAIRDVTETASAASTLGLIVGFVSCVSIIGANFEAAIYRLILIPGLTFAVVWIVAYVFKVARNSRIKYANDIVITAHNDKRALENSLSKFNN